MQNCSNKTTVPMLDLDAADDFLVYLLSLHDCLNLIAVVRRIIQTVACMILCQAIVKAILL